MEHKWWQAESLKLEDIQDAVDLLLGKKEDGFVGGYLPVPIVYKPFVPDPSCATMTIVRNVIGRISYNNELRRSGLANYIQSK